MTFGIRRQILGVRVAERELWVRHVSVSVCAAAMPGPTPASRAASVNFKFRPHFEGGTAGFPCRPTALVSPRPDPCASRERGPMYHARLGRYCSHRLCTRGRTPTNRLKDAGTLYMH